LFRIASQGNAQVLIVGGITESGVPTGRGGEEALGGTSLGSHGPIAFIDGTSVSVVALVRIVAKRLGGTSSGWEGNDAVNLIARVVKANSIARDGERGSDAARGGHAGDGLAGIRGLAVVGRPGGIHALSSSRFLRKRNVAAVCGTSVLVVACDGTII